MNKFELKLLKNDLKDYEILNASCIYDGKGSYEAIVFFKYKGIFFSTSSTSYNQGYVDGVKMPYIRLVNMFRTILCKEILSIEATVLCDNVSTDKQVITSYEINRMFSHLVNSLRKYGIYTHECEYFSTDVFKNILNMISKGTSALDCYKTIFSLYELPYEQIEEVNFSSLEIDKKAEA